MRRFNMRGVINSLLLPLILVILLLFGSLGFGYWAYSSRQDYKDNTDQKIAAAVQAANQQLTTKLNAQFAQKEKSPYSTYSGPQAYGTMSVLYPRTWSSYIVVNNSNDPPLDGYFYPGSVPDINNQNNTYALRVQVQNQPLSQALQQYQSSDSSNGQQVTIKPYALPKVPQVVGDYLTGQIQDQKQGEMVLLPLRGQTLAIWTEAAQFEGDFNSIILPNFTFSP